DPAHLGEDPVRAGQVEREEVAQEEQCDPNRGQDGSDVHVAQIGQEPDVQAVGVRLGGGLAFQTLHERGKSLAGDVGAVLTTESHGSRPGRSIATSEYNYAMPDSPNAPVEPRPAASVVIVRNAAADAPEPLEVWMIRRHQTMKFLGGYYAFPGGR